jgi:hypothetical protein
MYKEPTKKESAAFCRDALKILEPLGVRQPEEAYDVPHFLIETTAGELSVRIYEDWLACRFDDVARAKKIAPWGSLNPFSGKWNWMGLDTLPAFEQAISRIMPTPEVTTTQDKAE